jgi:hypothetical protein
MRLVQGLREAFYFPFYFVSLNMAGFLSFVRFIHGSQPPSWKKSDRVLVQVLCPGVCVKEEKKEEIVSDCGRSYEDENLNYPNVSSGAMR